MKQDLYHDQVARAAAAVRHLGEAVRGSRAFFIYRDCNDASQPSVIACHPPLSDDAILACFGNAHVVWEPVCEGDGHHALLGLATDCAFENQELACELTRLAAESLSATTPAVEPRKRHVAAVHVRRRPRGNEPG